MTIPMLDESQQQALDKITNSNLGCSRISILTGGPGRGKTFTVEAIVREMLNKNQAAPDKIYFAAPTGKAAKVLAEYLKKSTLEIENQPATIHRLLGCCGSSWDYNKYNPLNADLLIIDEASMIPSSLLARVFSSVTDNCKIVLVGDADQLPPVEAGCPFLDITRYGHTIIPVSKLTINHRAAEGGMIAAACEEIIAGKGPIFGTPGHRTLGGQRLDDLFRHKIDEKELIPDAVVALVREWHATGEDYQVLVPQRSGICGVDALNKHLQMMLNPGAPDRQSLEISRDSVIRRGDKVINTKNNYKLNIFNGFIGVVLDVDPSQKTAIIDFDGQIVEFDNYSDIKKLQLGYAITIHKSQGSQYKCGVIIIHSSHTYMLSRSLLYVAVSRFKEKLHVIGNSRAFRHALRNYQTQNRNTHLRDKLIDLSKPQQVEVN